MFWTYQSVHFFLKASPYGNGSAQVPFQSHPNAEKYLYKEKYSPRNYCCFETIQHLICVVQLLHYHCLEVTGGVVLFFGSRQMLHSCARVVFVQPNSVVMPLNLGTRKISQVKSIQPFRSKKAFWVLSTRCIITGRFICQQMTLRLKDRC